jgi:hypothetical protein
LRLLSTVSIRPYASASSGVMMLSRSMSRDTFSRGWPECWASRSSSSVRIRRISRAWISRSLPWPWLPPIAGWWIMIREFDRARRLPGVPPASSTAAALAAWPRQTVWMSGRTYCMVS